MKIPISRIKYFNVNGSLQILKLDKYIPINMLITLYNKFNLTKRDVDEFVSDGRNLGIFLNLSKKDMKKSDNVIINKDYSMLLLITERKLLLEDLKNLNKIIFRINQLLLCLRSTKLELR